MKTLRLSVLAILLLIFACDDEPFEPILYGSLKGVVLHQYDHSPIEGANISTTPVSTSVITSDSGRFVIETIITGEYDVIVEKTGFVTSRESLVIIEGDTTEVTIICSEKIETNHKPNPPYNEFPLHLSTNQDLDLVLSWEAEDQNEDDSLHYDVKLYSNYDPQFKTILSNSNQKYVELNDLSYNTSYFWQVIVSDGVNEPVNGPIWQFDTKEFPLYRLHFTRQVNDIYQIFSGDEDSGNTVQLTFNQNNSWRPRMNPQRTKIAFISMDGIEKHLYYMLPDGSNIQKVTNEIPIASFDDDFMNYCWSPNGAQLIYMNFNKLYRINTDGSGLILLAELDANLSFANVNWTEAPTPMIVARIISANKYDGDIYLMDTEGRITDHVFGNIPGRTGAGTFSVDGQSVLYTHDFSGFQGVNGKQLDTRIELLNLQSMAKIDLSSNDKPPGSNDLDPWFSPNGAYIIFMNTSNDGQSVKNIYKMNLEGQRVLLFENAEMPDWR